MILIVESISVCLETIETREKEVIHDEIVQIGIQSLEADVNLEGPKMGVKLVLSKFFIKDPNLNSAFEYMISNPIFDEKSWL